MYNIHCSCGNKIIVMTTMCGENTTCPRCGQSVLVPSLSTLKRDAGESTSMESTADQIERAQREKLPPFDGKCQLCRDAAATMVLPTKIRFLEERIITGSELQGDNIGYAPADETWKSVSIPFLFCDSCAENFLRGWKNNRFKATMAVFVRMSWLIPIFVIFIVLAAILPFVGWTVGAFIAYTVYRNATRKKADAFLVTHIKTLGLAAKLLDEDEYQLERGTFHRIDFGQ